MSMKYCGKCKIETTYKKYKTFTNGKFYEYEYCSSCRIKKVTESVRNWREKHPERHLAHRKVFICLRNGSIKKEKCVCGSSEKVQAHHSDYSKPLLIKWVCRKCHTNEDRIRRLEESKFL